MKESIQFDPEVHRPTPLFETELEYDSALIEAMKGEDCFQFTKRFDLLDDSQLLEFKKRVANSNGVVRVSIHPDFIDTELEQIVFDKEDKIDSSKLPPLEVLRRTIFKEGAPETIAFIDEEKFEVMRKVMERYGASSATDRIVYMLPTLHGHGTRKMFGFKDPEFTADNQSNLIAYSIEGMRRLIPMFSHLGVKKILVDGSSLRVVDGRLLNCVGSFMADFKYVNDRLIKLETPNVEPIKIEVGAATVPHGRKQLREQGLNEFL